MKNQSEGFCEEVTRDMLSKLNAKVVAKEELGVLPILVGLKK